MTLAVIEKHMSELAPYRKSALFNEFLVKGYTAMTLSSVSQNKFSELLLAKLCLGTLITLYDDFADRPSSSKPELLAKLYQFNFTEYQITGTFEESDSDVIRFVESLFIEISKNLKDLPNYKHFIEILNFDLLQFYSANRFSSLLTANPRLNNTLENRMYTHHNMGMICVAMMDLMATPNVDLSELGSIREVFLLGQRMGRIFNVLSTRQRELLDGDVTGELAVCQSFRETKAAEAKLRNEISELSLKIQCYDVKIKTFSVNTYLEGLLKLQKLHERMEGTI